MPAQSLHHLGDEPIYCEAVHDPEDDVYSGSDDDHYEGKLHRRLHIEKKAIDFLNGHVPVLLSARLQGPFDRQHWNNPWLSRRATGQVEHPGTQTTLSNLPVGNIGGHGLDQVAEGNLPNTQGTSLYPLPSPEITNPPSARKNPYMEEENYNRIKTWREAVKGISTSRDPFWLSQQGDSDDGSVMRKRSADQQWLHKRETKRRKPTDERTSPPDESPSQAASKLRKYETRRPQLVSLPAQSPSAHEDELATGVNTRNVTVASRRANRHLSTPRSRRIEQRSPHRKLRLQEAGSSEDELSMPSTTPTRKAGLSFAEKPKTPMIDGSPKRPKTATMNVFHSHNSCEQADQGRTQVQQIQASQLSARQRSSIDAARRLAKYAARIGVQAAGSLGDSPRQEATKTIEPVQNKKVETGPATEKPRTYIEKLADITLSQRDNSFLFHKRAKSPANISASRPSSEDLKNGTNPRPSSRPSCVDDAAVRPMDVEYRASHDEEKDDGDSFISDPASAVDENSNTKRQTLCEHVDNSEENVDAYVAKPFQTGGGVMESNATVRKDEDDKIHGPEVMDVTRVDEDLEAVVDVEVTSISGSARARELERNREAMDTERPRVLVQDEVCALSDPDWSTCLNTQDLSSTSTTTAAVPEDAPGNPMVEQDIDDPSDSDWSSYVDTQDLSAVSPAAGVLRKDAQSVPSVVYQGADDRADLVWSTFSNTQDQSAAAEPQHEDPESEYEDAMDLKFTNPVNCTPIVEDEDDSSSEWSTYRGASSPIDGEQNGDTSHKPVPLEAPQDANPSQASVGSIIDAYADTEQLPEIFGPGGDSNAPDESHQHINMSVSNSDTAEETSAAQKEGKMAMLPILTTPLEIVEAKDDSTENSMTDETTVSIELRKMADADMSDEAATSVELRQDQSQPNIDSQTPQAAENDAKTTADPSFLDQTPASVEPPHSQSPWAKEAGPGLQVAQAPGTEAQPDADRGIVGGTTTNTEPLEMQSPWTKEIVIGPHQPATKPAYVTDTPFDGSSSTLSILAGKALPFSQPPQSAWTTHTPTHSDVPTPDFTVSIKAFSDFATPSPTKKRTSFNGSILRNQCKTSLFQKPKRRVHFAPLPGEEEAGSIEVGQTGDDTIYVEEEVSYCTPSGRKTGTIGVPRPATRGASPPPMDVSSAEVGGILDHDPKFAKHFEAVAKRKKNTPRKALRLLPSDSQQTTTASQGVEAMAEAFIQASQTRRKALEMPETCAAENTGPDEGHDSPNAKSFSPMSMSVHHMEGQENAEPVDDVSAVLDNLEEFLDDTWGIGLGADVEGAEDTQTQSHAKIPQGSNGAQGVFDMVGDPMMALHTNVWAD